jgi:hypothetical protein
MYNMSFFRTEIIILIVVLLFVLSGHLFCSCAQTTPLEAFTTVSKTLMKEGLMSKGSPSPNSPLKTALNGGGMGGGKYLAPNMRTGAASGPTVAALNAFKNMKEGFTGANTNNGESSMYNEPPVSTTSWFTPNLTYTPGQPVSQGIQNILNRPKQPVPLPEGEMLMFKNTLFSGECCPNTYSNSMGCACMTVDQYNYLIDRGGNNVPYSEY